MTREYNAPMIENHPPETSAEQHRRLRGKRAGKPGEGFADIRIISDPEEVIETLGEQMYRLSRRIQKLCDYEDNPDQFMMHCPKCDLMNDFTITGRQIFYFGREWVKDLPPETSTTPKRISVICDNGTRVICKCGNCGEEFEPEPSPNRPTGQEPRIFFPPPTGEG